jgi:hypothetical protein
MPKIPVDGYVFLPELYVRAAALCGTPVGKNLECYHRQLVH